MRVKVNNNAQHMVFYWLSTEKEVNKGESVGGRFAKMN